MIKFLYQVVMGMLLSSLVFACATNEPATKPADTSSNAESNQSTDAKVKITGNFSGTVSYRERMALIQPFWLEVELSELKDDGRLGMIIAKTMVEKTNQVPVSFNLEYSTKQINNKKKYVLVARIFSDDKLLFSNTEPLLVFQGEDPKVIAIETQRVVK
jgi:uncharacterized lipoprotein YbaY